MEELVKKDSFLHKTFNNLTAEYHTFLNQMNQDVSSEVARAQDAIITRVFNFPTPID